MTDPENRGSVLLKDRQPSDLQPSDLQPGRPPATPARPLRHGLAIPLPPRTAPLTAPPECHSVPPPCGDRLIPPLPPSAGAPADPLIGYLLCPAGGDEALKDRGAWLVAGSRRRFRELIIVTFRPGGGRMERERTPGIAPTGIAPAGTGCPLGRGGGAPPAAPRRPRFRPLTLGRLEAALGRGEAFLLDRLACRRYLTLWRCGELDRQLTEGRIAACSEQAHAAAPPPERDGLLFRLERVPLGPLAHHRHRFTG